VEHLLREIKDISLNSIESNIHSKLQALRGLSGKIEEIGKYLAKVREGKMPQNNKVMSVLQVGRFDHSGNSQFAAQPKQRGADSRLLCKEQRSHVRNLYLRNG